MMSFRQINPIMEYFVLGLQIEVNRQVEHGKKICLGYELQHALDLHSSRRVQS